MMDQLISEEVRRACDAAAADFDTFEVLLMVREALPVVLALQVIHQLPFSQVDAEWRAYIRSVALLLETEIVKRHPELQEFLARGWKLGE